MDKVIPAYEAYTNKFWDHRVVRHFARWLLYDLFCWNANHGPGDGMHRTFHCYRVHW